jgi:hypothetical protein
VPCTVAVSCKFAPVKIELVAGATATEFTTGGGGAVTVIVAVADFVGSATLVAVTVALPVLAGAVNNPAAEIDPFDAAHVTAVFVVAPCSVAVKGIVPLTAMLAVVGDTRIDVTCTGRAGGGFDVAAAAVADNLTTTGVVLALLIRLRLPVAVPATAGVNAIANVLLAPDVRVVGVSSPDLLNPVPVTVASFMTSDADPVLVAVTDCEALPPTAAVTETTLGVTESVALPAAGDSPGKAEVATPPTQPDVPNAPATRVIKNTRIVPRFKREQFNVRFPN